MLLESPRQLSHVLSLPEYSVDDHTFPFLARPLWPSDGNSASANLFEYQPQMILRQNNWEDVELVELSVGYWGLSSHPLPG